MHPVTVIGSGVAMEGEVLTPRDVEGADCRQVARCLQALCGADLTGCVGRRHGADFGKDFQKHALVLGDGHFRQLYPGLVISRESAQADVQPAQHAADPGFGNDRLPVQRLKGMLDGLLVIPLDRYANRQSDERKKHEQQHRAIGRGELSDGILPCAGSCHRCVNSSFHQFKHGQKHGLQFCSIGRKNQPLWRSAAVRALIDRH